MELLSAYQVLIAIAAGMIGAIGSSAQSRVVVATRRELVATKPSDAATDTHAPGHQRNLRLATQIGVRAAQTDSVTEWNQVIPCNQTMHARSATAATLPIRWCARPKMRVTRQSHSPCGPNGLHFLLAAYLVDPETGIAVVPACDLVSTTHATAQLIQKLAFLILKDSRATRTVASHQLTAKCPIGATVLALPNAMVCSQALRVT